MDSYFGALAKCMLLLLLLVEYAFVTLKQKNISWSGLNQQRCTLDEGVRLASQASDWIDCKPLDLVLRTSDF